MTEYLDLWKLLAGLGLFLFAMNMMENGLRQLAGRRFRHFLRHTTENPLRSAFGGVIATAIVQSSSLVGLIVLAFVGAGIIPLANAIGIVLGSNLGTTFTGWIVAILGFKLDLSALIFPLISVGGLAYVILRGNARAVSQVVMSLALLLMGLDLMKTSVSLLTQIADVSYLADLPLIVYLLIGVVFTAIIQSSSATMMLTLSALYAQIIPLHAAAALVIGADLGTTSTVLLGSLQGAVAKRQLAMAHVSFNLVVDCAAFIALYPLLTLIQALQFTDPLFALVAFHNLFNLFGLILFLPFIRQFSSLLERWIKSDAGFIQKYIQNVPVAETEAAVEALTLEARHLISMVASFNINTLGEKLDHEGSVTHASMPISVSSTPDILKRYIDIKKLEGEIVGYALQVNVENDETLTRSIDKLINAVRSAVYSAKAIKDISADLERFHVTGAHQFNDPLVRLRDSSISIYSDVYKLLHDAEQTDIIEEQISDMVDAAQRSYTEFSDSFYHHFSKASFDTADTSSLLNINKEIHTSQKALLKSLKRLQSSIDIRQIALPEKQ